MFFFYVYRGIRDIGYFCENSKYFRNMVIQSFRNLGVIYILVIFAFLSFFLSIFTGSLIHEHYTRECEFGNFDKIKKKHTKKKKKKKKKKNNKKQQLLAEFLFK